MIRLPAVAGAFYPADPNRLREAIRACFQEPSFGPGSLPEVNEGGPRRIFGLVCPHAGYPYSGYAAAKAYHALAVDGRPETAVLIGPNHHGYGEPLAAYAHGAWATPLGTVQVDEELARELIDASEYLDEDELAHEAEHSLEVQLPFLQTLYGSHLKIVPIVTAVLDRQAAVELGQALATTLAGRNAVVIASTDLSHYVSQEIAAARDQAALEAILALDPDQLFRSVYDLGITMCGVVPVASLLAAAAATGGLHARFLGYNTSGDVTGDKRRVVGYASLAISKEA